MISKLASSIAPSSTLAITAKANELRAQGIDVVGFGAGEPDFDTPDYIKEAAVQAIQEGFTKYTPVAGIMSLREAIAHKLLKENKITYKPEQIVVNNGAKHSLTTTFMAILNPGDEVLIPAPFWLSYPQMVKMAYGKPVIVHTDRKSNFKLLPEQFEAAITEHTKAIILNSPSNPTGIVYTEDELRALAEIAVKHKLWIISDEIYEYLVYGENTHTSIAALSDKIYEHTITINGLSKSHAMTGWRIGYIAAPLEVAKLATNIQSHATSNANAIAQKAAEAAMDLEKDFAKQMVGVFEKRSMMMYNALCTIPGFDVVKPQGAFYCFVDVSALYGKAYEGTVIQSAADFATLLLEKYNVAVIPCADFGTPECLRLSYAIADESIQKGITRMRSFVEALN